MFSADELILQLSRTWQGNTYSFNLCCCIVEIVTGFIKNRSDLLSADATGVIFHENEEKPISIVIVFKLCGHWDGVWKLKIYGSFYHQFFEQLM